MHKMEEDMLHSTDIAKLFR